MNAIPEFDVTHKSGCSIEPFVIQEYWGLDVCGNEVKCYTNPDNFCGCREECPGFGCRVYGTRAPLHLRRAT